jgi:regulator of protease activity HflC (stomatin/prohibitin superfamily)
MWRQIPKTETTVLSIRNKPELVVLDVETRKPFVDSSGHYVRYVPTVYDYAYHLFAWAPLSVFVLTILYLLIESFSFSDESRKVKIGWCGILLLLNSRTKIFLNEGDHPLLPWKWLFSVASVNLQKRELVADSGSIYTADHAQAEYTLTLYLRVTEPFAYLDKSNPEGSIQTTALSVLREHVQTLNGNQADVIQNNNELKQEICRTINESQWGVTVFEVAITNVRIEEEYHKALLAIAVEKNQAESEKIQMGNVRERIKELIEESKRLYPDDPGKWISFSQAADIVAIQQGDKVQGNTVKTFNIHADESAAAGAGLLFGFVDSIAEALGANRGGQNQQGGRRNRRRDANRGGQNQQGGN